MARFYHANYAQWSIYFDQNIGRIPIIFNMLRTRKPATAAGAPSLLAKESYAMKNSPFYRRNWGICGCDKSKRYRRPRSRERLTCQVKIAAVRHTRPQLSSALIMEIAILISYRRCTEYDHQACSLNPCNGCTSLFHDMQSTVVLGTQKAPCHYPYIAYILHSIDRP